MQDRRTYLARRNPEGKALGDVLRAGDHSSLDRESLSRALFLCLLLNADDPIGRLRQSVTVADLVAGHTRVTDNNHLSGLHLARISPDPVLKSAKGHSVAIRNILFFCEQVWNSYIEASVRRHIVTTAPGTVLLRWLGDVQTQQRESSNTFFHISNYLR